MLFEKNDKLFIGRFGHLLHRHSIIHAVSTRKGGVSAAPYESLNLGINTEDVPQSVRENRSRFLEMLQVKDSQLVIPVQVHGDRVHPALSPGTVPDTDSLVTNQPGLMLSVQTADCLPVFLIDPVKPALGLVHAGWRSAAKRIASKTVRIMAESFGSDPADLLAFFGPSIGPCCCAVGKDTAGQFDPKYIREGRLDLWQCNADQLLESGMRAENIIQSRLCTVCHPEWFFSHRASGGKTGRMLGVLGLREE